MLNVKPSLAGNSKYVMMSLDIHHAHPEFTQEMFQTYVLTHRLKLNPGDSYLVEQTLEPSILGEEHSTFRLRLYRINGMSPKWYVPPALRDAAMDSEAECGVTCLTVQPNGTVSMKCDMKKWYMVDMQRPLLTCRISPIPDHGPEISYAYPEHKEKEWTFEDAILRLPKDVKMQEIQQVIQKDPNHEHFWPLSNVQMALFEHRVQVAKHIVPESTDRALKPWRLV